MERTGLEEIKELRTLPGLVPLVILQSLDSVACVRQAGSSFQGPGEAPFSISLQSRIARPYPSQTPLPQSPSLPEPWTPNAPHHHPRQLFEPGTSLRPLPLLQITGRCAPVGGVAFTSALTV